MVKISIDVPETWRSLKEEHDLSWRHILKIGIHEIEKHKPIKLEE